MPLTEPLLKHGNEPLDETENEMTALRLGTMNSGRREDDQDEEAKTSVAIQPRFGKYSDVVIMENATCSSSSQSLISRDFQKMEIEPPFKRIRNGKGWKALFVLGGVLIGIVLSTLWRAAMKISLNHSGPKTEWTSWSDIKYVFVFGDSWTDTAFDPEGAQPSPENPLGNPAFPGRTAANATNWVGYLTTKYNASFVETYNLAVSGATLDNHVVQGYPWSLSVQVYERFMARYANNPSPPWNASDSLFVIWTAIVDLVMMNGIGDSEQLAAVNGNLTIVYGKLLNSLYGAGARNFLLLNVPPLKRCWQPGENAEAVKQKLGSDGAVYSERVKIAAKGLKDTFSDTNVFLLDTREIFIQALDYPNAFPQTSGILNTTEPCSVYQCGTPTPD